MRWFFVHIISVAQAPKVIRNIKEENTLVYILTVKEVYQKKKKLLRNMIDHWNIKMNLQMMCWAAP